VAANGWRLSCAADNFCARGACAFGAQNSTKRNKFHADNKINYTKVIRYKELNNKNVHPPQAMLNVPRSSGRLERMVRALGYFFIRRLEAYQSIL
jgi:hypothetical protein